ncbi:MAG: M28 family peptidase [Clostridia bacterium]|nr:M28 family peptidase [Clostridia bacterium]
MTKMQKILTSIFSIFLCALFLLSVIDTAEWKQKTNFDQDLMMKHVEKLSENGPRSVTNPESNQAAMDYIASVLQGYSVVNEDTMEKPAYVVQSYIAEDDRYQSFALQNIVVHIPANAETKSGEAVMFMGHTDSVPMGPGSSDDGVACATMLEAIRYYLEEMKNGKTHSNDLLFCFVNGEEYGLYGSKALQAEFTGFNDVLNRVKFLTNLESRGTSGTVIMFETAKNNYETVKLFSEVNKSLFTCSIATLVYDTMPNYTDFTTFKETYQGLNMANITGGENYHTQNDNAENVGEVYLSQQAQIVDALIEKLGNYELSRLYDADESAIFFSYLNLTTVVYDHTAVTVLAVLCILLVLGNVILGVYRKTKTGKKTAKAFLGIAAALALGAGASFLCYYVFQWIAVLTGAIDVQMVGTVMYSNTAIVIGIGILALATTVLAAYFSCKLLKIEGRDLARAFAYLHAVLGIAVSFALPSASYLFIFSGILFAANELLITAFPKKNFEKYHFELLVTALYFPLVIPVIVLATSALGLKMAYVYAAVFTLAIFDLGVAMIPVCRYLSVRMLSKKVSSVSAAEGACHILAASLVIFLCVSFGKLNASVNLQGKQNIVKLPYDDALIYVVDEKGNEEYRIYDLNSVRALKPYSPEMRYVNDEYYVGTGEKKEIALSVLSAAEGNTLNVKKSADDALVYLEIKSLGATSFTVADENITRTYTLTDEVYAIKLHSDCTVTFNGAADVSYKEVVRDYAPLIPAEYANDNESLHFNLWMIDFFAFE